MFTFQNKISDLLEFNPQLILMLPRFGMKLGFGEKRVDELCREYNVPVEMFILLCNVYSYDDYIPSPKEVEKVDGVCLVRYLEASHEYYLNHRLKHISKHLEKIAAEVGNVGKALMNFFREYENDVLVHFKEEEETLFPYILSKDKKMSDKFNMKLFASSHDNLGDKLSDITNIIIKHLPGDVMPSERIGVWFDIVQITKDLKKHAIIEEKILMPYVKFTKGNCI